MTAKLPISSMKARIQRAIAEFASSYASSAIDKAINVFIFSSGINTLLIPSCESLIMKLTGR